MSVKQSFLDFRVTQDASGKWMKPAQEKIGEIIKATFQANSCFSTSSVTLFTGVNDVECTLRLFPDGLITLDILQYIKDVSEEKLLCRQDYTDLKDKVDEALSCVKADFIPTICRGRDILCYHDTSDGQFKEYDFDKEEFRHKSQYQDIWIVHSNRFGNMLFLDLNESCVPLGRSGLGSVIQDLVDHVIAEGDIVYTKALLGNGRENYKDKEILILGGGDGGVLHELLKESPKFVTMVEIDKIVVEASAKYLRGVCGDTLDSYTGPNYEVRIEDCIKALKEYVELGKTFDYVINDLTDIPINVSLQDSNWDFVREISNLALQVLEPGGKFYSQGTNGSLCKKEIEQYEDNLRNLCFPVEFKREFAFVPSFMESWTFYEVWRKQTGEAKKA